MVNSNHSLTKVLHRREMKENKNELIQLREQLNGGARHFLEQAESTFICFTFLQFQGHQETREAHGERKRERISFYPLFYSLVIWM